MHKMAAHLVDHGVALSLAHRVGPKEPFSKADGAERKAGPAAGLRAQTAHDLGAAPAEVEHDARAPAGDFAQAEHHRPIDEPRLVLAGKDAHRDPDPLADE